MLEFRAADHTYWHSGVLVPGVTTILKPLTDYSMIPPHKLEIARQKGVAVHKMVELYCKDDLNEETLPEWMLPVLEQWKKFATESGFEMVASEQRVYCRKHGYAGTFDLFGTMRGKPALIDIKRSFLAGGVIGLQLAAYLKAHTDQPADRYALKLNENGPYRLEPYTDQKDFSEFMACLAFYRVKEKHS